MGSTSLSPFSIDCYPSESPCDGGSRSSTKTANSAPEDLGPSQSPSFGGNPCRASATSEGENSVRLELTPTVVTSVSLSVSPFKGKPYGPSSPKSRKRRKPRRANPKIPSGACRQLSDLRLASRRFKQGCAVGAAGVLVDERASGGGGERGSATWDAAATRCPLRTAASAPSVLL